MEKLQIFAAILSRDDIKTETTVQRFHGGAFEHHTVF